MHELIAQPKMLLVVIVYLIALVGTGAYFAKKAAVKKEGKEDFFPGYGCFGSRSQVQRRI